MCCVILSVGAVFFSLFLGGGVVSYAEFSEQYLSERCFVVVALTSSPELLLRAYYPSFLYFLTTLRNVETHVSVCSQFYELLCIDRCPSFVEL